MSTAYVECPQCGGKALSIATRCPHCGSDFPPRPPRRAGRRPDRARLRPLLAVAGVLAVGTVLVVVGVRRTVSTRDDAAPAAAPRDTVPAQAPPPSARPPAPIAESIAPAAPRPPEVRSPAVGEVRRYARTWTNVRAARSRSAPAVRMLNPGDAVVVDSLRRGWYRVLVDGRAIGYVYRSTLGVAGPAVSR